MCSKFALEELHRFDYRDDEEGKSESDEVFHEADVLKAEGLGKEGNVQNNTRHY